MRRWSSTPTTITGCWGQSQLDWMDDTNRAILGHTFLPSTLKPHMDAAGVHRSVIVEAGSA